MPWKVQVTFCKRGTLGTKGRGGGEHFALGIAQLSLIRLRSTCWSIMENNASKKTSPSNFTARDYQKPLILEDVIYDRVNIRKT